jgi:hypothetical protein
MNLSLNHDPAIGPSGLMSAIRLWFGLFGAPAAWIAQIFLSEPLAAHACYPYQTPLSEPIWKGLPATLLTLGLACLALALLSGFAGWRAWRQPDFSPAGKKNRNRFLVKLSLMSSFIFIAAIIFNLFAVLLVSPCSSWF